MAEAAIKVGVHFNTFKKYAKFFGVYRPNPQGKGLKKERKDNNGKIPLSDILKGLYPEYQTFKLKNRLFFRRIKK